MGLNPTKPDFTLLFISMLLLCDEVALDMASIDITMGLYVMDFMDSPVSTALKSSAVLLQRPEDRSSISTVCQPSGLVLVLLSLKGLVKEM